MQYIWDDFIQKSSNGTIFHYQKFLNYHISRDFNDFSLMFFKGKKLIAVFPAVKIINKDALSLISHPGASFGGFIIQNENTDVCKDIITSFLSFCLKQKINYLKIVPTPEYYIEYKRNIWKNIFINSQFKISQQYISHVIYLTKQPIDYFNQRKKRYIKNKINNPSYSINKINRIHDFYSLLLESKKQFNTSPTHSLEELNNLIKIFPEKIITFATFYNQKIIGGMCLFKTTQKTALLFYNVVSLKFKKKHIGAYQIYHCIKYCIKNKMELVDLGVSYETKNGDPFVPKISLMEFKEQCGAKSVIRNIYTRKMKIN